MTFEEYLAGKRIDATAFRESEPARWGEFKVIFEQVHPNSFTQQKLYLINQLRRKYKLNSELNTTEGEASAPKPARPVFKPKIK